MLPPDRPDGPAPYVVGIAGGTASGKTTVALRLAEAVGAGAVALVPLDAYYQDGSDRSPEQRATVDYDHPDALDWPLLLQQVDLLRRGRAVEAPVYDFSRHLRSRRRRTVAPSPVIVVEGILALHERRLRDRCDLKVYVDADADVRLIRRLRRDVAERGRTTEQVIDQYLATVRPAHTRFVEPTKQYADVVVPKGGEDERAVALLLASVREVVRGRGAPNH